MGVSAAAGVGAAGSPAVHNAALRLATLHSDDGPQRPVANKTVVVLQRRGPQNVSGGTGVHMVVAAVQHNLCIHVCLWQRSPRGDCGPGHSDVQTHLASALWGLSDVGEMDK